jgi:hypothetical protein
MIDTNNNIGFSTIPSEQNLKKEVFPSLVMIIIITTIVMSSSYTT